MEDTHQKVRYLFSILGLVLAGNVYGQAILPLDPNGPCPEGYNMYYFDLDGDGYGNPNMPVCDTSKPSNAVHNKLDCDDTDSSIYPGAPEINDGKDNNCDGVVDNGLPPAIPSPISVTPQCGSTILTRGTPPSGVTWYWQSNASGTSTAQKSSSITRTSAGVYYLRARHNTTLFWSAARSVSYTIASATLWYEDADGDGFGDPLVSQSSCSQPPGYVSNSDDQCPHTPGANNGCPSQHPDLRPTLLSNENYVLRRVYQRPLSSPEDLSLWSDVIEQVTYYDGLGRPKQQVAIRAGADGRDLVTPIVYDSFGRQTRDYLPVPMSDGAVGGFRSGDMETAAAQYYREAFAPDFATMTNATANPYSQRLLEASPLNRMVAQGAPGKDWALGSGHEVVFEEAANHASEVRLYQVSLDASFTPTLVASGFYQANQLFKRITYDQQHTDTLSRDHTTQEFTDKQGRLVLLRRFEQQAPHDTYYVYDPYGNLTYILPPKVELTDGVSATELQELCYQFQYDHRDRLIKRKVPGKGWEHLVYNKLDRPILRQDALLRQQGMWEFTKYDAFGRMIYSGMMASGESREALQTAANSLTSHYEQRTTQATTLAGTQVFYSNTAFPTSQLTELHQVHYYDRYLETAAQGGISLPTTTHFGDSLSSHTKTLPTISRIRVLDTPHWITRVMAYDRKGREVWSREKNPYLDSEHLVENQLDFVGKVEKSRTTHTKSGTTIQMEDTFTYDHMGRPLTHTQKINNQPEELIARNHYDALGQLVEKQVGGAVNGPGLQNIAYQYNVRGWLKNINDPDNLGADLFGFEINYNAPRHGAAPLFNGNISETAWKTASDHSLRWYQYDYDALSRLTQATAWSSHYHLNQVSYDKNGNIATLSRQGAINASASNFGAMDNLSYTYPPHSNQLQSVSDAGSALYGFKTASSLATQYTYDFNGNLTSDAHKGITSIDYNHLNLPTRITFDNSPGQRISYTYDATGVKLSKQVPGKTTQYSGDFVYENLGGTMELQFFSHPEGYVSHDNGQFHYVYQYRDHLGNIRLSYTDANQNGTIEPALEIIQEKNYYPFGLTHRGYNQNGSSLGSDAARRYGFGGKELQDENISGNILDWYDVSARNYDPALGRWMSVDPLADADKNIGYSPYSYAINNPISYIDPDGRCWQKVGESYVPCDDASVGSTTTGAFGNSWTMTKNDGWQLTNGADLSNVNYQYDHIKATGDKSYYVDRYKNHIEKYNTRPPDYYLEYGYNNKVLFDKTYPSMSNVGKEVFDKIGPGLQNAMNEGIRNNPSIQGDNRAFKKFAYDSHFPVYKESGIGKLGGTDLIRMGTTPKLRDTFGSPEGRSLIKNLFPILFSERPRNPELWDPQKNPGLIQPGEPKW